MSKPDLVPLYPYQKKIVLAVLDSVVRKRGLTFTVEIARQGGKNEISAHLEAYLMYLHFFETRNLIKCTPTFKPQAVVSMMRLKEKLRQFSLAGHFRTEGGYMVRLGDCRTVFLSAEEKASVVGNTAHVLLEVDEAQDVNEEKFIKEFKPMGSTTNVTSVLYGTTWDDSTLLERMKQINLELERSDGIRRHFRFDWQEVARCNPDYLQYVEGERARLGDDHPLFLTQYRLLPVHSGGGFFSSAQRVLLQGFHPCRQGPEHGSVYVAGIDLAGEEETDPALLLRYAGLRRDSVVLTIGEVIRGRAGADQSQIVQSPSFKIVKIYSWTGRKHPELYPLIVDIIRNWRCTRVAVDATGIGEPCASYLRQVYGKRVLPVKFTAQSKSDLGFNLLATVNSGNLKMYAADNSSQYREFWHQMERAKSSYRSSRILNFYVDPGDGHDDFLMSAALLVHAGKHFEPREAHGRAPGFASVLSAPEKKNSFFVGYLKYP